jgi:hypothetical protein
VANPPAAWHPDPTGAHDHRWWDGERWTEHVADAGVASVDPLPSAPPGAAGGARSDATQTQTSGTEAEPASDAGDDASRTREMTPADTDVPDRSTEDTTAIPPAARATPQPDTRRETPAAGAEWAYGSGGSTAPRTSSSLPSGMAITALVLGILSIPLAIMLIGGLLGVAAVVVGAIASSRAKRGLAGNRGLAIGGIITGVTGIIVAAMTAIAVGTFSGQYVECMRETGNDQQLCQERLIEQLLRES